MLLSFVCFWRTNIQITLAWKSGHKEMAGKEDGERDDLCDDHVTNMAVCGYLNEFKMKRLNFRL